MKAIFPVVLALCVAAQLCEPAFGSTPRYPGVSVVGGDTQERSGIVQPTNKQAIHQTILELVQTANPLSQSIYSQSQLSQSIYSQSQSIQILIKNAEKWKWELDPLDRPNFNIIPAADIGKYRYTEQYLDLADTEVSHYFILNEDFVFRNLDGRFDKIPAGFIWDGASIPKVWGAIGLEVGNTRYNSAIAEGLIHDYMYRNPHRYTKDEADALFYVNLKRCNNLDPLVMSLAVVLSKSAEDTYYRRHQFNQRQGYYDVFTSEFYAENLKTFQSGNDSSLDKKVDISKLERLLKEQIAIEKSMLAKSGHPSRAEAEKLKSAVTEYMQEIKEVLSQIQALPVAQDEKRRIADREFSKLSPLIQEHMNLVAQLAKRVDGEAAKIFGEVTKIFGDIIGE